MGVRLPSVVANSIGNAVGTAEIVVATTPPMNIPLDFATILLFWYYATTTPASTTNLQLRLRRGTTTAGTLVSSGVNQLVTASATATLSGFAFDVPGAVAGQQYSLTAQFTAAVGSAGPTELWMLAMCL